MFPGGTLQNDHCALGYLGSYTVPGTRGFFFHLMMYAIGLLTHRTSCRKTFSSSHSIHFTGTLGLLKLIFYRFVLHQVL